MKHNVLAPSVGESITEVRILKWARSDGDAVKAGDLLLEIESDKATVEVVAESAGALTILKKDGETVAVGANIGIIDDAVAGKASASKPSAEAGATARPAAQTPARPAALTPASSPSLGTAPVSPAARKHAAERGVDLTVIQGSGKDGRIMKGDVLHAAAKGSTSTATPSKASIEQYQDQPGDRRVPMSRLRAKIAERLVYAQHTAAILTTFNECDMTTVMQLRNKNKDAFKAKHGVALSFMSFFTRAVAESLKLFPDVNASIDGTDVIYHDYLDIGIAVGTERGLVVPVIRGVENMGFVDIEKAIAALAEKARTGKLSIADMSGGTFTISNGGVYGSLMSTPILNPPQSGILGMHKIQERPMAVSGKIEIRPMMYLALSYDHRLIDGKGAVSFLIKVKEFIENPSLLKPEF